MIQDFRFSEDVIRLHLKEKCEEVGLREFCRKNDLDAGNVSKVINGKKPMQEKIAKSIGFRKITIYEQINKKI